MPFGQNLITSAALKAAPTYNDYYGADYYGTEYSDYNAVEVEEYYYEGFFSTCFLIKYIDPQNVKAALFGNLKISLFWEKSLKSTILHYSLHSMLICSH